MNALWSTQAILRQRTVSSLAQVMAYCLTAPSQHLNHLVSVVQWQSHEDNFTKYTYHNHQLPGDEINLKIIYLNIIPISQWPVQFYRSMLTPTSEQTPDRLVYNDGLFTGWKGLSPGFIIQLIEKDVLVSGLPFTFSKMTWCATDCTLSPRGLYKIALYFCRPLENWLINRGLDAWSIIFRHI